MIEKTTSSAVAIAIGMILVLAETLPARGLETAGDPRPTLFVVGDSTASNSADLGWGSHLGKYFDPNKIAVINRARGGRSSRTFITEGLWDQVLDAMKSGDYVLIQFGHNDAGRINDRYRARGSLRGLGDETAEINNRQTGRYEVVHTYGWYMREMIADTQAEGATPIVLSLTVRNEWPGGRVERDSGPYSKWAGEIAEAAGVTFIPLTEIIADQYELLGPARVKELFPKDHTHTSVDGANLNAALVVAGIKALDDCPLAAMLSPAGQAVTPYGPDVVIKQTEQWLTRPWMPQALPASDPNLPTLFAIGDSTVRTGSRGDGANGQWGWGAPIADFFDRTRINVENRAWGGTSSRTFRTLGFWDKVLTRIKPGDYVIMQFGHNDSSPLNDRRRARGTIKGAGDETEEIDNLLTGQHEIVHTYGWYLRRFIKGARAKGATSVVCSPIPRNDWRDGRVRRNVGDYGQWAAEAARAEGAPFIDLNAIIADHYDALGQEKVTALYFGPRDGTHTNAAGARRNAACVVEGLRALADCPLSSYLEASKQ